MHGTLTSTTQVSNAATTGMAGENDENKGWANSLSPLLPSLLDSQAHAPHITNGVDGMKCLLPEDRNVFSFGHKMRHKQGGRSIT